MSLFYILCFQSHVFYLINKEKPNKVSLYLGITT